MTNQSEIFSSIEKLIPGDLWEEFNHLSFGEMASVPELEEWWEELKQAEIDWFDAEDA